MEDDGGTDTSSESPGQAHVDQAVKPGLVLEQSGTLAASQGATMSARQAILLAVDGLESENDRLHQLNSRMEAELLQLREENAQLKRELGRYHGEVERAGQQQAALQQDNRKLRHDLDLQASHIAQEAHRYKEQELLVNIVKQENAKYLRQMESLQQQMVAKDREFQATVRELQAVSGKLERSSRKNFSDRDIELLHEVQLLKEEKQDLVRAKGSLEQNNAKLCEEMANLQSTLDRQLVELKNENRRHTLLTKEFNSLLEENNHLKLQLRRRHRHGTVQPSKGAENHETVERLHRQSSNLSTSKKFHSSNNLPITRESTLLMRESNGSTRDLALNSREQATVARERTTLRRESSSNRLGNAAPGGSREGSGASQRGSVDGALSVKTEDSSSSTSDALPSINVAAGRTWKP